MTAAAPRDDLYIVDLESGNLQSVAQACLRAAQGLPRFARRPPRIGVGRSPRALERAGAVLLPGVGAFPALAARLRNSDGLVAALEQARAQKKPVLGICVGMQLMAERGLEHGETKGLAWIEGEVVPIEKPGPARADENADTETPHAAARVPRMGWAEVRAAAAQALMPPRGWFYFAHSFQFVPRKDSDRLAEVAPCADRPATCGPGTRAPIAAAVGDPASNLYGVQFHPEKSADEGLALLGRFLDLGTAR